MSVSMFLGITFLARALQVRTDEEIHEHISVLAQIGQTVHGRSLMFFLLQAFTAGILILAANTAYQDFPRLSAILARDRFMPTQFRNRGDRLVFSNGIVVLAVLAGLLIWAFDAELTRLIQLYVVGVFTAFTLSQTGMVRRWRRMKGEGWRRRMAINAVGAATTGIVLVIVAVTKFTHGAWIVIAAIPLIVAFLLVVHRHYLSVGRALHAGRYSATAPARNRFLLLVPDLGPATSDAVAYLRALRPEAITPLFIGPPERFGETAAAWRRLAPRLGDLEPLKDGHIRLVRALRGHIRGLPRGDDDFVTVVIPETLAGRSLLRYLLRGSRFWLKAVLLFEAGVVICDIPLVPEERAARRPHGERPLEPERSVVLVPVSAVHDATVRAVVYAKSLRPVTIEGLYFAQEASEVKGILDQWVGHGIDVPLSVVDAPFRDIRKPLLEEIRAHTRRGDTVVTVVLPEFVVTRWWEHLLHGQTGLFIKRLLLFEPEVVVVSVPYHLSRAAGDDRQLVHA